MKIFFVLLIFAFLFSCRHHVKYFGNEDERDHWQISNKTSEINIYNKFGLLDTIFQHSVQYVNGVPAIDFDFIIKKNYDSKKNLVTEKTYSLNKNGGTELNDVDSLVYDFRNNCVFRIRRSEDKISSIHKMKYDDSNRIKQQIDITKRYEPIPKDWTLDSLKMHKDDKKNPHYDTFCTINIYNKLGESNKGIVKMNSEPEDTITTVDFYSNNKKIKTLRINSRGDTINTTSYLYTKNQRTEIENSADFKTTIIYENDKIIESVSLYKKDNYKLRSVYKYDSKGNQIEEITYK